MKAVQYTSSISAELMKLLDGYAGRFKIPKNRIIEDALRAHFEKLKATEYTKSFKRAADDKEVISMAEEGLEDYLTILAGK